MSHTCVDPKEQENKQQNTTTHLRGNEYGQHCREREVLCEGRVEHQLQSIEEDGQEEAIATAPRRADCLRLLLRLLLRLRCTARCEASNVLEHLRLLRVVQVRGEGGIAGEPRVARRAAQRSKALDDGAQRGDAALSPFPTSPTLSTAWRQRRGEA